MKGTPIVGDKKYDHAEKRLVEHGLFLCSNSVILEHPYFNSEVGRKEFGSRTKECASDNKKTRIFYDKERGKVLVEASIALPEKFFRF